MEGFYSTQAIIGLALVWWGLGVLTVAVAWGIERWQAERRMKNLLREVSQIVTADLGHVVDYHGHGPRSEKMMHAHCICGEMSLDYSQDDPTAERLMEQWADNHIDSLMESADV